MSNSERNHLHNWIDKLTDEVLKDLSQSNETDSRSCIFLDSKTINLLLVYMLMNKEMQLSKVNLHPTEYLTEMEKEIDALIAENEQHFEELIERVKKQL